ncbi:hypothetical protein [Hyphomonas sp.]|uniref:hypothetical protein n=1 Tax=Hyphomonas sp. TaxID=87 RepID=UPI0032EAC4AC
MTHDDEDGPSPALPKPHLNGGSSGEIPPTVRDAIRSAAQDRTDTPLSDRLKGLLQRIRKLTSRD